MTIIFSCIPNDGTPAFIAADMLVSSSNADEKFDFPSGRNLEAKDHKKLLNEPFQKLYVLHPHVVIAIAGDKQTAQIFFDRIQDEYDGLPKESNNFIEKISYIWKDMQWMNPNLRKIAFTILLYDEISEKIITHSENCNYIESLIGTVYLQGTGCSQLVEKLNYLVESERLLGEAIPDDLSICRAMSLCYALFSQECVGNKGHTPLKDGIGWYYEFVYFCNKRKSFQYVDNILVAFWPFFVTELPHFGIQFGHHPRDGEEEKEHDFRVFENNYNEDGIAVRAYSNKIKIDEGHIMALKEYRAPRFLKSLYPIAEHQKGKFVYNFCYLIGKEFYPFLPSGFTHVERTEKNEWIKIDDNDSDDKKIIIRGPVYKAVLSKVHEYFDSRWVNFDKRKIYNLSHQKNNERHMREIALCMQDGSELRRVGTTQSLLQSRDYFKRGKFLSKKYGLRFYSVEFGFLEGTALELIKEVNEESLLEYRKQAEKLLLKAMNEFKNIIHITRWTQSMNSLGIFYTNELLNAIKLGETDIEELYNKAKHFFSEAGRIQENMNMVDAIATTKSNFAKLLGISGYLEEALKIIDEAIKYDLENKKWYQLAQALNKRSYIYNNMFIKNGERRFKELAENDNMEAEKIFNSLGYFDVAKQTASSRF